MHRVAVLLLVASAAFADVPIAPPEYGPQVLASGAGAAALDGTWLVAWVVGDTLVAARVDRAGRLLDVPPRALARTGQMPPLVRVLTIGDRWYVFASAMAVIVRSDGTVDGEPHVMDGESSARAATNGDRVALISWVGNSSVLRIFDRNLQRLQFLIEQHLDGLTPLDVAVTADGGVLVTTDDGDLLTFDTAGRLASRRTIEPFTRPMITAGGDRFLVAWHGRNNAVMATVVDGNGRTVAAPRAIASSAWLFENDIAAAANGDGWTMFYAFRRGLTQGIEAVDLTCDGTPAAAPRPFVSAERRYQSDSFGVPALAPGDDGFLLLRLDSPEDVLHATRFRSVAALDTTRIDIDAVSTSAPKQSGVALAPAPGGSFVAVWYEQVVPDAVHRVRVATITPDGITAPLELQRGFRDASVSAVAANGAFAAVAWEMDGKLMAAIITLDGTLVVDPFVVSTTAVQQAAIAWNGPSLVQFVWTAEYGHARAAALALNGGLTSTRNPFDFPFSSDSSRISMECNGGVCVAAWSLEQGFVPIGEFPVPPNELVIARFDAGGNLIAVKRTIVGEDRAPSIRVDPAGNAFLFLQSSDDVVAMRVSRDGSIIDRSVLVRAGGSVIATTFDGFFAIDFRGELRFYDFAGNRLRDYGFQYVPVDAVARSGSTDIAIVEEGRDDPLLLETRLFVRLFGNAAHHHRAAP